MCQNCLMTGLCMNVAITKRYSGQSTANKLLRQQTCRLHRKAFRATLNFLLVKAQRDNFLSDPLRGPAWARLRPG